MPNKLHEISTVIQTIDIHDIIKLEKSENIEVKASEGFPSGRENIVYEAARRLNDIYGFGGVKITIEKAIPAGAGLGGASSNAAATIKALIKMFDLTLTGKELISFGHSLGSDIPAIITGGTVHVGGTGEVLTKLKSPFNKSETVVIVMPKVSISTAKAYENLDKKFMEKGYKAVIKPFDPDKFDLRLCENDFERWWLAEDIDIYGEMRKVALKHKPVCAAVTGSGAAFFAIFNKDSDADNYKAEMAGKPYISKVFLSKPVNKGMEYLNWMQ